MSNQSIAQFFESVYNDRALQGALNAAVCKIAPEVVAEMAATKGYKFTAQELRQALGGGVETMQVAQAALATSFWAGVFGGSIAKKKEELTEEEMAEVVGGVFKETDGGSSFGLTIPGPAFIQVRVPSDREPVGDEPVTASAVDIFEEIQ